MTDIGKVVYLQDGTNFTQMNDQDLVTVDQLPPGNYIIAVRPITNQLYLQRVQRFTLPERLYGDIRKRAERILNTYQDRPISTGVLLSGEKGSGKTQLARLIAETAAQRGWPTILINQPYVTEDFFKLISNITQPCVILFDEFEKVYKYEHQQKILTLLDGVFPSKKLYVFTCNDKWLINDHMRNRPGRIYYLIEYKGIEEQFVREYCADELKHKKYTNEIVAVGKMFAEFNFDMLKALVEEVNRYNESPREVIKMLNTRPSSDDQGKYLIRVSINGKPVAAEKISPAHISGTPLSQAQIAIKLTGTKLPPGLSGPVYSDDDEYRLTSDGTSEDDQSSTLVLTQGHLATFDGARGQFTYTNGPATVTFTRTFQAEANVSLLF